MEALAKGWASFHSPTGYERPATLTAPSRSSSKVPLSAPWNVGSSCDVRFREDIERRDLNKEGHEGNC